MGGTGAPSGQEVQLGEPQPMAHAHNDDEHDRPLDDAPALEEARLEPLSELISKSGRCLCPGRTEPIRLLVDTKSDGPATWTALQEELGDCQGMLSSQQRRGVRERAVEVVVSGSRPIELRQSTQPRCIFYDDRTGDLGSGMDPHFMPLVSDNWSSLFTWKGVGLMPAEQLRRLHDYVDQAHAEGCRVRFWATPDSPGPARDAVWNELRAAGVDHITTDDLGGLEEFLSEGFSASAAQWPACAR